MSLLSRWRQPPELHAALRGLLQDGERVLAWARSDPGYVIATNHALLRPVGNGHERLGWEHVRTAVWGDDVLTVTPEQGGLLVLALSEPRRLPEVVRDRVTAGIVLSRLHRFVGGGGVRIVARRRPQDRRLLWTAVPEPGTRLEDPDVAARVRALLDVERRSLGADDDDPAGGW